MALPLIYILCYIMHFTVYPSGFSLKCLNGQIDGQCIPCALDQAIRTLYYPTETYMFGARVCVILERKILRTSIKYINISFFAQTVCNFNNNNMFLTT